MNQTSRELIFTKSFHMLAIFLYAGLFLTSLFITGVNSQDFSDEYIILERHSLPRLLLITAVFGAAMFLLGLLYDKVLCRCSRNILLGGACAVSLLLGIYWVSASGTAPRADQGHVVYGAVYFNGGDFGWLQKGNYFARYSHLLGLVTLMRVFFRLFPSYNYISFQYFNALMLPLIIFCGARILRKLPGYNSRAEFHYLALTLTCFPMYAYTAFVYGELTSTAAALLAAWLLLSCLEKFSFLKAIGIAIASGIAVQLRKNTLIVLIAFGIVVIVCLLRKLEWRTLAAGLSALAGVVILQAAVSGLYRDVRDPEAKAMPAILWVSMGLHDTDGNPGWFDGSAYAVFEEVEDDVDKATQVALEDIRQHLERFQKTPYYMWDFYGRKVNTQWQAPMYQSIVMNNSIVREQSRFVQMIYQEELLGKLIKLYMKAFQVFLYGSILFWLLSHRKDRMPIEAYILLIAVFGGFLFSVIWEAKTRYVFPYLLLMIPYFSMGIEELSRPKFRCKSDGKNAK